MMQNSDIAKLAQLLQHQQWRITTAESCTGGGIAKLLTDIPCSSSYFDRGVVTYSEASKVALLNVSLDTIANHGVVSTAVAKEMAAGALAKANADIAIATTGFAGPDGGTESAPVGTVCFAWAFSNADTVTSQQHFSGDREQIREYAIAFAINNLLAILDGFSVK